MIGFLLVCLAFPAFPVFPSQAGKVEKNEFPDKRAELARLLDDFRERVDKRGQEDARAIAAIPHLVEEFAKSGPKDRAAITSALDKALLAPRTPLKKDESPKKEEFDDKLALAAAAPLGQMGPESVKLLIEAFDDKSIRHDLPLLRAILLALGHTRDKDAIKPLIAALEHPEISLVASAGEALGEFVAAKLEQRKEIVGAIVKKLMSVKNGMDDASNSATQAGGGADNTYAKRYDAISAPFTTSLKRLAKHEENDPNAWERWWNKNKNADWDAKNP